MRFTYISAHAIRGIAHPAGESDISLYCNEARSIKVLLTSAPDDRLFLLNRNVALLSMMFCGQIKDPLTEDFPSLLNDEITRLNQQRKELIGSNPVVLVEISGEIDAVIPKLSREVLDFVLCFDAFDKKAIKARHSPQISAILTALRMGTGEPLEFRPVCDGSYLTEASGRIIHSVSTELGRPSIYVSRRLGDDQLNRINTDVSLALAAEPLERVMRLHAQSLGGMTDNYRAFLAAWSALEILVGKLFHEYQQRLAGDLRAIGSSPGLHAYLDRVSKVMADKYSLADKFAVLSVYLDDTEQRDEVSRFRDLKRIRDKLAHGEELDESSLPTREAQQLFDKYLRNHLRQ